MDENILGYHCDAAEINAWMESISKLQKGENESMDLPKINQLSPSS
jgi:hypothetical protein